MSALSAVRATHVGHLREERRGKVSCTECTGHRNDVELITTVKMAIRNPV